MTDDPPLAARVALRATFNTDPERYDRARPGYPAALFDDLAALTGMRPGARVLEIGPGTGKATQHLLERGYVVTAVELGADLAEFTRRKLARFAAPTDAGPRLRVDTATFEAWSLPTQPFDVVLSAQAWHWLDPATRLEKAAAALTPHGSLALFGHYHVAGGDRALFEEIQRCYERFMPGTPPGLKLIEPDAQPHEYASVAKGQVLFEPPTLRRYAWEQTYSTPDYLELLSTYSGHIELEPEARVALFECIATLIDTRCGGRVRKAYVTDMAVARKR